MGLRNILGLPVLARAALFAGALALLDGATAYGQAAAAAPGAASSDDAADASGAGADPAQAERASSARLAAARQQSGETSLPYAFALRDHARSLMALGKFGDAEAQVRQALAIVSGIRGADNIQAMVIQSQLGAIVTRSGRASEAEPLLRQACETLKMRADPQAPATLTCQTNLATNLIAQSRYHEAEVLLRHIVALRVKASGPQDPVVLAAKLQLGRALREEGDRGPAEAIVRAVVEARRTMLGDRNALTLTAIGELADVLVAEHRGAEAEPLYRINLKNRSELLGERHPETLLAMDMLARDLATIGRADEAEPLIRQALATQAEVLGETHPNTLASMNTLAFVLRAKGQPGAAEAVMRHVLALRTRQLGPDNATTLTTTAALAMDIAAQGRRSEAEQLLTQVIAGHRREGNGGRAGLNAALVQLGFVRLAEPDRAALALDPLREAVAGLRDRRANASYSPRADIELSRETLSQAGTYRLLAEADWAAAQAYPEQLPALREEAFLALQDAMAGTVTQSFALAAARASARAAGADIGALADERQQLADQWRAMADHEIETISDAGASPAVRASPGPNSTAEIVNLAHRINAIDAQLQSKSPGYFALTRPAAVPLATAQALLGPDEAVLLVVPSFQGTHVMALTHEGLAWHRSSLNRAAMIKIVRDLRSELDPDALARSARSFDRKQAYQLYQELVAPLEPALVGKKQLFIAADGALASLPFDVLVTSAPAGSDDDATAMRATQWFGDAHALIQLPSLQTLQFLRALHRGQIGPFAGFQGFGDPKLGGSASTRGADGQKGVASVAELVSLPGTADELRHMASALDAPAATVHLADADTKSAVQSMDLSQARILAFATHGLLPGELRGVDEPGLVFTPPATPSADDDGFLSTSDITQLKLDADLVILSACNSGSGDGENAPPLSGLARSFFYAGARVLLVSHWPVYDDVAPRITVEVIAARRANPGLSLAEALQSAVRKIREDKDDPSLAFPSAWAPFVIVGDWRPF